MWISGTHASTQRTVTWLLRVIKTVLTTYAIGIVARRIGKH